MLFLILLCFIASTSACPSKCSCRWYRYNRYVNVNCRRRNLNEIPTGIPTRTLLLDLQSNNLTHIKPRAFEKLPNLIKLLLGSNSLTDLHADAFVGLVNLKSISLAMNQISILREDAFKLLKNLESLGIPENRISRIEPFAFRGLEKLRELTLTKNRLSLFDINSFQGMPVLEKLNLGENLLQNIIENGFSCLSQLTVLEIPDNEIKTVHSNAFFGISRLELLDLSGNRIRELERNTLKDFSRLITLRLDHNKVTHLRPFMFDGLKFLDNLHLQGNEIKQIDGNTFSPLRLLRRLFLHENNLQIIDSCTFNGLLSVRVIKAHTNRLKSISNDAFAANRNLEELYLQYNELDIIEDHTFNLPMLRLLDLSNNRIFTIKPFTFHGEAQLWDLNLYGNRLQCTCNELSYLFSLDIKNIFATCILNTTGTSKSHETTPTILSDADTSSWSKWSLLPAYNADNSSTLPCCSGTRIKTRQCVPCSKVSQHPWCVTRTMSTSREKCVSFHTRKISSNSFPCHRVCQMTMDQTYLNLTRDEAMDEMNIKSSERCSHDASVLSPSQKDETKINNDHHNVSHTVMILIICGFLILSTAFLGTLRFLRKKQGDNDTT